MPTVIVDSNASNPIVTGAPGEGYRIAIQGFVLTANADANKVGFDSYFNDTDTFTDISGDLQMYADGERRSVVAPYCPDGLFIGRENESIRIRNDGGLAIGGFVLWKKIKV